MISAVVCACVCLSTSKSSSAGAKELEMESSGDWRDFIRDFIRRSNIIRKGKKSYYNKLFHLGYFSTA